MNNINNDKFINKRYIICKNTNYINLIKDYWVLSNSLLLEIFIVKNLNKLFNKLI
ncbi:hypothetical protein GCM10008909_17440 [Hathewaya limosa]